MELHSEDVIYNNWDENTRTWKTSTPILQETKKKTS